MTEYLDVGNEREAKSSKGKKKSKIKGEEIGGGVVGVVGDGGEETGGKKNSTGLNNSDSDSSDVQAEKCPICLLSFKKQEIATPETCEHSFCLDCLVEWSKNINTCPVDRQNFNIISVRKKLGGKVRKI